MSSTSLFLSIALLAAAVAVPVPCREKPDMSPEKLRELATHVVVGDVVQIWTREESKGFWDFTHYVAEIAVGEVEKGKGVQAGELLYARYWTKQWDGPGPPPADTNGHRGLPKSGERARVYLARDGYDGFGTTNDHGFNVIGANGFERP
jgi:hypothetical protein